MTEFHKNFFNDKNNNKINNLSRNNHYVRTEKNSFNNKILKSYINTYDNKIENIKAINNTESNRNKKILLNKTNIIKNKSFAKLNFNEVLNFNFGSQNPAQLKLINTTMLTTNSPDKLSKLSKTNISIKRSKKNVSSFNGSPNLKLSQTKYLIGYSLTSKKDIPNKHNNIPNKKTFLSEEKFLTSKNGILRLPRLSSLYNNKKIIPKKIISQNKDKILIKKCIEQKDFDKLKQLIEQDNNSMNEKIAEKLKKLKIKLEKYKSQRPDENTQEGIEKLFHIYNKKRGKKYKITTNLTLEKSDNGESLINIETKELGEKYRKNRFNNILLDTKGNPRFLLKTEEEKNKSEKLTDFEISTLANRANRKVEQKFPDLCAFNLPKVLNQNKEYNLKLLYDVFIEFKSLLKCGMVHNKNLSLHKQGIDFDTFFNCNTKINQQGIALSKKIFKAFNNKTNLNYMSWQNYFDGMMKIKDQNIDNKLDLFFQILDENGDGSFDYNEVFNLSLISLQRVIPKFKKNKEQNNEEENVTHILAEFLTKFVFELVGIDINGEIPIDLLRAKMEEKNEKSGYLEFFLCADNFA